MNEEIVLIEHGNWAEIRINRIKQYNALNTEIVGIMDELLDRVEQNKEIRVLVFTGEGEKAFISGADIGQMGTDGYMAADAYNLIRCGYKTFNRIEQFPLPTIAAINGYCLGGGLELALCCDIRLASSNARFALPEINLGIIPGWGGTIRLPRIIGEGRAKHMIFQAKRIDAACALEYGLVTEVHDSVADLREATVDLATDLAGRAPISIQMDKKLINRNLVVHNDLMDGLSLAYCFTTDDSREGIAAFLEKRTPLFKGK